ncbi:MULTISPECIES: lipopolysaccharide biosynthesis protein [unclassified Sphingomonas]|uniref:lipopolysaccharide biosynthesis protein n=1 Tax=unclassified Sphingomonas TaxID=196159 RepID=UPI0007019E2E|nr:MULTISPECIES: hypothetical protein [unclassified Sphingomonas]KQX19539.1 hypothetical protein ASD17_13580 [Sphingomonas sp. Root1294]KQY65740.1 hypothetical protein ASD39_16780 [Sphingomonas sp. Root50]KRB94954.1 hypothetical protein ASE22_03275 [Sphingomonas sp. Root720]
MRGRQVAFLTVNVVANMITLVRSYVTMQALDHRSLGIITVMQTLTMLVSLAHLGLLNGGYRLLCSADDAQARRINDTAYGFFIVLTIVTMAAGGVAGNGFAEIATWVVLMGIGAGLLMLVRNWMNNQMIAEQRLDLLNRVTIWSAILSLLPLVAVRSAPLEACILSISIQPAIFILVVLTKAPSLRPRRLSFDVSLLRTIFGTGFLIFLSGMMLQLSGQMERWYVTRYLGLEALGHLYLALLAVNLFAVVPNALQWLHLPRIIQGWDTGEGAVITERMRLLFLSNAGYCLATLMAVLLLVRPVIERWLPAYTGDLLYVYLILPGLILYTLFSAPAVIFSVLIRYRLYYAAFGAGTLATGLAFAATPLFGVRLGLVEVMVLKSATYTLTGAILLAGFWALSRKFPAFRFGLASSAAREE